jgi:hypothetical protein
VQTATYKYASKLFSNIQVSKRWTSDEAISAQEPILKANASNTCAAVGLISTSLLNPPPWSDQFGLPPVVPVVQTPVAPVIPIPTLVDSVENNSGSERAAITAALSVVVAFLLV